MTRSRSRAGCRCTSIWHPHNVGYGGNQKTCYLEALQRGADVVVMLHPDGQYEPIADPADGGADPATARPTSSSARGLPSPGAWKSGMPRYKFVANRGLTVDRERACWAPISPSCTRATAPTRASCCSRCRSCATRSISSFDSEMIMQAVHFGFRIAEVPARPATSPRRLVDLAGPSRSSTGCKTLVTAAKFILHRSGVLRSRKFMP